MTTLLEVTDGLAARLDTIADLRVYDLIPDNANYPAALIDLTELTYTSLDIGASRRAVFSVYLLVPRGVTRKQRQLYTLIDNGPGSVMAAVLADRTLGGLNVNANPVGGSVGLDTSRLGLTELYGRTVPINVFIS